MIKYEEAKKIFKKKYPDLTITESCELHSGGNVYFLFTAVKDPNKTDYSDPYYAVNVKDGKIYNYVPFADFENYSDAVKNRKIE